MDRPGGPRGPPQERPCNPKSAQERPALRGLWPLKKLQPGPLAAAAAAQQHSYEPWGTPLRARGTVADDASTSHDLSTSLLQHIVMPKSFMTPLHPGPHCELRPVPWRCPICSRSSHGSCS